MLEIEDLNIGTEDEILNLVASFKAKKGFKELYRENPLETQIEQIKKNQPMFGMLYYFASGKDGLKIFKHYVLIKHRIDVNPQPQQA